MQIFGVHTNAIRQCRGGKPHKVTLKPRLMLDGDCSLESVWARTFAETVSNMHFHACFLCYVDNRLFCPQTILRLACVQRMEFYGQAIVLEDEQEYDFLGFQIGFAQGVIRYNRSIQEADLLNPLLCFQISCPGHFSQRNAAIKVRRSRRICTSLGSC